MYDQLFGPDRDPVDEPGTATGTPGDWWTVVALSPDVLRHAVAGVRALPQPRTPARPGAARARPRPAPGGCARASSCSRSTASRAGRSASARRRSRPSRRGRPPTCSTTAERAVLAYTDALVRGDGRVPDALFDQLRRHLADVEILELTYITCLYEMHALMSRALRLEFDDRARPDRRGPRRRVVARRRPLLTRSPHLGGFRIRAASVSPLETDPAQIRMPPSWGSPAGSSGCGFRGVVPMRRGAVPARRLARRGDRARGHGGRRAGRATLRARRRA